MHVKRIGLVLLMSLGSVTLWIASPLFWLWLCGRLLSTQPSMGPYALMLAGIVVTSIAIAKGLSALNRAYARTSESGAPLHIHLPWHRMRGAEHESRARPVSVLDVVMVISVVVAGTLLVVWFVVVQPAPPGVGPGGFKD